MQPGEVTPPEQKPASSETSPPVTTWQYTAEGGQSNVTDGAPVAASPASASGMAAVHWTASEYVAHQKNVGWYLLASLGVLAVSGIIYAITRELISSVVIGIVGLSFVIFGARPPRVLEYVVGDAGIQIGERFYPYQLFRSFSILEEEAVHSVLLMPMRRFGMPITLYYELADEAQIVAVLGSRLPHEQRQVAPIDRFMSKIRF